MTLAHEDHKIYEELRFLVTMFHRTINGNDFIEVAKRTVRYIKKEDLELIWLAFKAMHND